MKDEEKRKFQVLLVQLQALEEQREMVQESLTEIERTIESIDGLGKIKEGEEILLPLGSGIFTYGKLGSGDELLLNIGANVLMKKRRDDAVGFLKKRREELEKVIKNISSRMVEISRKMERLEK